MRKKPWVFPLAALICVFYLSQILLRFVNIPESIVPVYKACVLALLFVLLWVTLLLVAKTIKEQHETLARILFLFVVLQFIGGITVLLSAVM